MHKFMLVMPKSWSRGQRHAESLGQSLPDDHGEGRLKGNERMLVAPGELAGQRARRSTCMAGELMQ